MEDLLYEMYDNLINIFNNNYDALGAMVQKGIQLPDEMQKFYDAAKRAVKGLDSLVQMSINQEMRDFIENGFYNKKQLLDGLERGLDELFVNQKFAKDDGYTPHM